MGRKERLNPSWVNLLPNPFSSGVWKMADKMGTVPFRSGVEAMMRHRFLVTAFLFLVAVACVGLMITIGSANIGFFEAYGILIDQLFPGTFGGYTDSHINIVTNIRGPRVLMGFFVGMILAIGGCIIQSILRNSLATPYTLGVSSSACFGAAVAIAFGLKLSSSTMAIIVSAFLFSLIPIGTILLAAQRRGITPITMVLCGVAISQIFGACNTILQYFSADDTAKEIVFWSVGSLNNVSPWMVPYVAVAALAFALVAFYLSRDLNILKMGDDTAQALGVNVSAVRTVGVVASCVATAVAVSFTGAIGFICLISPHVCRLFIGSDLKYLIPASGFLGCILLLVSDTVGRTVIAPTILPVGAVTALIGGPLLVYLLMRRRADIAV